MTVHLHFKIRCWQHFAFLLCQLRASSIHIHVMTSQSVMEVTSMCRTECETLVLIKISYKENEKRKLTLGSWTLTLKKIKNILPFYDCLGKKNYFQLHFFG